MNKDLYFFNYYDEKVFIFYRKLPKTNNKQKNDLQFSI